MHGAFGPNRMLAAAPWNLWQATGCVTSSGVARFAGGRRCGKPKTLRPIFVPGHAQHGTPNATPLRLASATPITFSNRGGLLHRSFLGSQA